jgi:hypothetical protein
MVLRLTPPSEQFEIPCLSDYQPLARELLAGVETGQWQAITSTVTIMELTSQGVQEACAVRRDFSKTRSS